MSKATSSFSYKSSSSVAGPRKNRKKEKSSSSSVTTTYLSSDPGFSNAIYGHKVYPTLPSTEEDQQPSQQWQSTSLDIQKLENKMADMQVAFDTLKEERRSLVDMEMPQKAQDTSVVSYPTNLCIILNTKLCLGHSKVE